MKKAFSLIEILVVVAILSILSSIGIFVYSGLIESAEERSVKSNCASVKKYIENELSLCAIGKKTVMSGKLNCERYIADDVAVACMDSLASSYPNNFDPEKDRRAGVYKSDDMQGRNEALNAIVKGKPIPRPGTPESFKVLMRELQSLGLDIGVYTDEGKEVDLMQDVNPKRNTPSRPTYESLGTSEYAED